MVEGVGWETCSKMPWSAAVFYSTSFLVSQMRRATQLQDLER